MQKKSCQGHTIAHSLSNRANLQVQIYKGEKDLLIGMQKEAGIYPHKRKTAITIQIQKQNVIISIKANVVCAPHDQLN